MDHQSLTVLTQMSNVQEMFDILYNTLTEHSKKAQAELQSGMTNVRDEVVEAVKIMLETQSEHLADLIHNSQMKCKEPEVIQNVTRDNHMQLEKIREMEDSKRKAAQDYAKLRRALAESDSNYQNLHGEHQQVVGRLSATQQELEASRVQNRALTNRVTRLQGHLTKNATNSNEMIDSAIRGKLEMIRARTQSIVKKYCVGKTTSTFAENERVASLDDEWKRKLKVVSEFCSRGDVEVFMSYWIRSKLYMVLEMDILNRPVFGLEENLELKLAELEDLMLRNNADRDTSDWRALTLRNCEPLSMTNKERPERTAMLLENLFSPWILGKPGYLMERLRGMARVKTFQVPPQLRSDLVDLCQSAYDLAVMLRKSTDRYYFETVKEGTRIEAEEQVDLEPEDIIGPKQNYVGSKVWACLFGKLVKETQDGERHVMVKAHVVCEALQSLPSRSSSQRKRHG